MESASSCRDSCDRTKADPNEMSYSQLKPSMNTTSAPVRQQEIGGKQKRLYALTDVTNAFRGSVSLSGEYAASGERRRPFAADQAPSAERPGTQPASKTARGRLAKIATPDEVASEKNLHQALPATLTEHIDIDQTCNSTIQMVPAYAQSNHEFMRELEVDVAARPDYVTNVQTNVTSHMRAVLVDWLIEVSDEFKLVTETLYLTISYIDRFLSVKGINNSDFQLLGVACMCVAAKYEEIHPPQMEKFSYITDHVCTVDDISDAEAEVLEALQFRLSTPTAKAFLQRYLRAAHVATTVEYHCLEAFSRYILELSLLDYSMLRYRSSMVAAAATLLARTLLAHQPSSVECPPSEQRLHVVWTRTMEIYTCHTARDLEECVRQLHRTLVSVNSASKTKRQPFVCHKYSQAKWGSVATMHIMPVLPSTMFDRFAAFPVPAKQLAHCPL